MPPGRIALTTDSATWSRRLFFPGGDIGSLAVHGTVNDLAMGGARPLHLTAGFILEEGLPLADLRAHRRLHGRGGAGGRGDCIITGDTKVVERGKGDGVFINTAGIGRDPPDGVEISGDRARPGNRILVSGTLGDHGVAIMSLREGLKFETSLQVGLRLPQRPGGERMVNRAGAGIWVLRDPTRGGLAASLNEIADQSGVGIRLHEDTLPIRPEVRGACELLGLDPLNVANEGKLIAIAEASSADALLQAMREDPLGGDAAIIGEVLDDPMRLVRMVTRIGGERVIDWLHGEQLPRIC
ncbi:MAG: hydrogenase expression/formation protein HypE [Desulfobacterales bacterium]|nr:hydrogenase expression/formation protein HypE [Desulfobacterales bacterium]